MASIVCIAPDAQQLSTYICTKSKVSTSAQKKGKLSTSHRYNLVPLLRSRPGGVGRELVVQDLPYSNGLQRYNKKTNQPNKNVIL